MPKNVEVINSNYTPRTSVFGERQVVNPTPIPKSLIENTDSEVIAKIAEAGGQSVNDAAVKEQMVKDVNQVKAQTYENGFLHNSGKWVIGTLDQTNNQLAHGVTGIMTPFDTTNAMLGAATNPLRANWMDILEFVDEMGISAIAHGMGGKSILEGLGFTRPKSGIETLIDKVGAYWNGTDSKDTEDRLNAINASNASLDSEYQKQKKANPLTWFSKGSVGDKITSSFGEIPKFFESLQNHQDINPVAQVSENIAEYYRKRMEETGGFNTSSAFANEVLGGTESLGASALAGVIMGKPLGMLGELGINRIAATSTGRMAALTRKVVTGAIAATQTEGESLQIARDTYLQSKDENIRKIAGDNYGKAEDQYIEDKIKELKKEQPDLELSQTDQYKVGVQLKREFQQKWLDTQNTDTVKAIENHANDAYQAAITFNGINFVNEYMESAFFLKGNIKEGKLLEKPTKWDTKEVFKESTLAEGREELINTAAQDAGVKKGKGEEYGFSDFTRYLTTTQALQDFGWGAAGGHLQGTVASRMSYKGRLADFKVQQEIINQQDNIGNADEKLLNNYANLSNTYEQTARIMNNIEVYKSTGNEVAAQREANRLLSVQVATALASGTTENLIKNYQKIADNENFSIDTQDENGNTVKGARTLAKEAITEINALEKIHDHSMKFNNSEDVYQNKVNERFLNQAITEAKQKFLLAGGIESAFNVNEHLDKAKADIHDAIYNGTLNVQSLDVDKLMSDVTNHELYEKNSPERDAFEEYYRKSGEIESVKAQRLFTSLTNMRTALSNNNEQYAKITSRQFEKSYATANKMRSELEMFAMGKERKDSKYDRFLDKEYTDLVESKLKKIKNRITDTHYQELELAHYDNVRRSSNLKEKTDEYNAQNLANTASNIQSVDNAEVDATIESLNSNVAAKNSATQVNNMADRTVKSVANKEEFFPEDAAEGLDDFDELSSIKSEEHTSNDPEMIDDNTLSNEDKQSLIGHVKTMFDAMKGTNPKATFKDLVNYFSDITSKESADKAYDLLYKGYKMAKLSGYENMNWKATYNEIFKVKDAATSVLGMLPSNNPDYKSPQENEKEEKDQEENHEQEVDKENGGTVETDQNGNKHVIKKGKALDTELSTLDHSAGLKSQEIHTETTGEIAVTHELLTHDFEFDPFAPGNLKILHPDLYGEGTVLTATIHPNFMDIPVSLYDKNGKVGQSMKFSEWVAARNSELVLDGKQPLKETDQEYIDKIPMAYTDQDGDIIGFVPDMGRASVYHNTEDTLQKYTDNTRNIRNRVSRNTSAIVRVDNKTLGHSNGFNLAEPKFLNEIDPTIIVGGYVNNNNQLTWGSSKPKDIIDEDLQIGNLKNVVNTPGNPFEIRRTGTINTIIDGKVVTLPRYYAMLTTQSARLNEKTSTTLYWAIATYLNKNNKTHSDAQKFQDIITGINKMTNGDINLTTAPGDIQQLEKLLKLFVFTEAYGGVTKNADANTKINQVIADIKSRNKSGIATPYIFTQSGKVVIGYASNQGIAADLLDQHFTSDDANFMQELVKILPKLRHNVSTAGIHTKYEIPSINKGGILETGYKNYQEYMQNTQRSMHDARPVTITRNGKQETFYPSFYQPTISVNLVEEGEVTQGKLADSLIKGIVSDKTVEMLAQKIIDGKELSTDEIVLRDAALGRVTESVKAKQAEKLKLEQDEKANEKIYEGNNGIMLTKAEFLAEVEEERRLMRDMGLDTNATNDPRELTEEEKDEIVKSSQIIKGLKRIHQVQMVDYIFNNICSIVNLSKTPINVAKVKESIRELFSNDFSNKRARYQSQFDRMQREMSAHPELQLQGAITEYQTLLNQFDLVTNHWTAFEDDALGMVKKYFNIKQGIVTNLEDANENEDDETLVEQEDTKDHDHSKTSFEVSNKEGVSSEVKRLCQNIQARDANGKPMTGLFGVPIFVGFDTVFNSVSSWLAGTESSFESMKSILGEYKETNPWVQDLIDKLEVKTDTDGKVTGSQAVQNQFVTAMTKHPLDMEFVMMIKDRNGNYSLNVYSTNSGAITTALLSSWKNNLKSSDTNLIVSDKLGNYTYSVEAINRILKEGEALRGNYVGLNLGSNHLVTVKNAVEAWLRNANKNPDITPMTKLGFYDATRTVTITGEEKAALVKSIGSKSAKFEEAGKNYTVTHIKGDEFQIQSYKLPKPQVVQLIDFLKNFGIRITEPTAKDIINNGFRYDSEHYIKWENQWDSENKGNSMALISNLLFALKSIKQNIETEAKSGISEADKTATIYNEDTESSKLLGQSVVKALAFMEAKHTTHRAVQSFYDNHKSIYGFVAPTYITDRARNLKLDPKNNEVIPQLMKTQFSKNSFWLNLLSEDSDEGAAFRDNFLVKHLGLTSIKELGKALYRDNGLQEISDKDHELVKLGFFQSMNQGSVKTKNSKYAGFGLRIARMFSPTMSDKGTMTIMKTAVLDITAGLINSQFGFNRMLDFGYSQLIAPELGRINDFNNRVQKTNIDAYDQGAKMFLLMPSLNNLQLTDTQGNQVPLLKLLNQGLDFSLLENTPLLKNGNPITLKELLKEELFDHMKSEQNKKLEEWKKSGYIKEEEGKITGFSYFDKEYMKARANTIDEQIKIAAMDFTFNSMVANANSFMAIAGDPATMFKQNQNTKDTEQQTGQRNYIDTAKDTFTNVGKRLASQIAPRTKMADADSKNSTYMQIMLGDSYRTSPQIKGMTKYLDNKEISDAEINSIRNLKKKEKTQWALDHGYKNSADYFAIESTNAQEYTTWREHLLILEKMGKLSDDIKITTEELTQASDIFSGKKTWEQLSKSQQDLVKKVLQPMKPVYTGQIFDEKAGMMRNVYIKTSSYPLIPQLTAGFEIDKLAKTMEKLEASTGKTVRASYASGNKVGGLANPMASFDNDGNFIAPHESELDNDGLMKPESIMNYALELPRANFGIQQNVPLKSYQKEKDEISMGTQITKLMFGNKIMGLTGFNLNGQTKTGMQLHQEYFDHFDNMISSIRKDLYHELGMSPRTGQPNNQAKTIKKLEKILKSEAVLRGYPKQDIEALGIDPKTGTFNLPLWLSPNANRYEALLTAIITHRVVKVKFPGYSYVAGSQTGFKIQKGEQGIDKSQVVFTSSFDGELKGNQCFAASKLRIDGKLINIMDFATKVGNKWMIDTDKISPEVMKDLVSFRIPSSKHSSLENLEIVGFLPESSADLMVVSMDGTVAMGEDYDVDKRFTYHPWTTFEDGKIILLDKSKKYQTAGKQASDVIQEKIDQLQNDLSILKRGIDSASVSQAMKDLSDDIEVYFASDKKSNEEYTKIIKERNLIAKLEGLTDEQITNEIQSKRDELKQLREDKKKVLQNEIIAIQAAVLNHPEVKKLSAEKLSVEDARQDAEFLSETEIKNDPYFTPLSDMYQKSKVAIGAIGKNGTAAYSLDVVSHSLFEQAHNSGNNLQLQQKVEYVDEATGMVKSKYIPMNVTFGDITSTGELGHTNTLMTGVDSYKGIRAIADVISERQNLMVDNEKEQIAIRVHLNKHTMMVDKVLNMLGFDKQSDGNGVDRSVSFMFISQPIIKEYVRRLEMQNSNTAEYNPNKKQDIINQLLKEYGVEDRALIDNMDSKMSVAEMVNQIKNNGTDLMFQAVVLDKFLKLDEFGTNITSVQTNLNIDSKGIGRNLLESMEKLESIKTLAGNKVIKGADKLIGDYQMGITDRKQVMDLIGQGYLVVTRDDENQSWDLIKPTTISGSFAINGLVASTEVWSKFFPYGEKQIQGIFNEIIGIIGNSEMRESKLIETKQLIFNNIKKFLYTDNNLHVFGNDAQTERRRLFFDHTTTVTDPVTKEKSTQYIKKSLATFLDDMTKSNNPVIKNLLKNNKLLQRFTYDLNKNNKGLSLIKFDNSKAENFDEDYLYNALVELVEAKVSLDDFDGKPYDTAKLAQDLVSYSYLEGGIQEATQFIKYIPVSYLKVFGINNIRGFLGRNTLGIKATGISDFSLQFIQHNPGLVTKLTEDQMKVDANYKKITQSKVSDLSTLISFTYDANDGSPKKPFLSIYNEKLPKDQSKFQLYVLDVNTGNYNLIPSYGAFGMSEYMAGSIGHKSLINNTNTVFPPISTPPLLIEPELKHEGRFNTSTNDPKQILTSISEMDSPMGKLAKLLLPLMSNETKFMTHNETTSSSNGRFISDKNMISISENTINTASDEDLARVILRESVHSITDSELLTYTKQLPVTEVNRGSIVQYNGKEYIFWNKNESGKAQLIDIQTGEKFSGTPNMDKLTVTGLLKTAIYNKSPYIVTKDNKIYSGATGNLSFEGDDSTSKTARESIITNAVTVKNGIKEFIVTLNAPKHIKRLAAIFSEVQKLMNEDGKLSKMMEKQDASGNWTKGLNPEEYSITYAGTDIFEFVERMMTSPELQNYLNTKKFRDSDLSIMDKFKEWISEVLNEAASKLGLKLDENSITAQSISSIFETIQAKQGINQNQAENTNSQAAETVTEVQSLLDEIQSETEENNPSDDIFSDEDEDTGYENLQDEIQDGMDENKPSNSRLVDGKYVFKFADGIEVTTGFKLNSQQEEALQKMADYANDDSKEFFTLMGYAGTGKTTIVKFLNDYINKKIYGTRIVYSSPTNRANAVLKQSLRGKKVKTLHSVFGLSPEMDLEEFDITKAKFIQQRESELGQGDFLIIDEGSMVNDDLFDLIEKASKQMGIKVLFMGDPAQIKPVKQNTLSKVFGITDNYELTKVERTGNNPLLAEVTNIRNSDQVEQMSLISKENDKGEGVTFMNAANKFITQAITFFKSDEFKKNPLLVRVLAYTNAEVKANNDFIRQGIFGENAVNEYNDGEIIMGYSNFDVDYKTKEPKLINSGDYIITHASKMMEGNHGGIPVLYYDLHIKDIFDESKSAVHVRMLSKTNSQATFNAIGQKSEQLRVAAINMPKGSREAAKAWSAKSAFEAAFATPVDITYGSYRNKQGIESPAVKIKKTFDYGYSHTIHKSQGGTYKYIMVDTRNIAKAQDPQLIKQLKYVALSRAQKHAYVVTNLPLKTNESNISNDPAQLTNTSNISSAFDITNQTMSELLSRGKLTIKC